MAINLVNDNISTIEIQGKKYNIKAIPFHGTAAEWENNNYIPKDGEIIIYDIDENYNYKRIKIGNGTDIVSVLPFLDEDIASRILALETWSQEIEEKIAYIDYETKEDAQDKLTEAKAYTDFKTSTLASTSSVNTTINTHNTSTSAHEDIRALIDGLTTRLNTVANSDDTTLDQLSEIVAYIKSNKSLIDGITTSKINVSDIVNNLTTNTEGKVLSAAQGVVIQGLIDALQTELDSLAIADISGLQSALDGKAASFHTHDDRYYTETEVDTAIANSKNTWYGTCPTTANTAAKVVTTNTGNFSLKAGNIVYVLFTYAAYSNSTLNVDGTGAIAIKTADTTGVVTYQWAANEAIGFVYDGTYFRMLDGMVANTTYYGMTKLSSSTSSTSTTMAATPSAVKSAYDLANTANTAAANLQSDVDSLSSEIANLLTYEDWVFTLQDGSMMTKQIYTGSLSTENWTFTLENGSTITKGVYVG